MASRILEEMYLDINKIIYESFLNPKNNEIIKEFKKYTENKFNNFINLFENYKGISIEEYQKESLQKEYLGEVLLDLFKGEELDNEKISLISNSSATELMNALELKAFSILRKKDKFKMEIFIENKVQIEEMAKSTSNEYMEFNFINNNIIETIKNLGESLSKFLQGEILNEKEIKTISSTNNQYKIDSIFINAPIIFNLREEDNKIKNFINNEIKIEKKHQNIEK